MTTEKINYQKQAKELSYAMHNQLIFMSKGVEMTLPGADDVLTKQYTEGCMNSLFGLLQSAYAQGDEIPDNLPMQNGLKLDVRLWKEAIYNGKNPSSHLVQAEMNEDAVV